jgi:GWxTD domain-containing protein
MPNPGCHYGQDRQVLYYYVEIYNLSALETGHDSTYTVKTNIKDINNEIIDISDPEIKRRMDSNLVHVGREKLLSPFSSNLLLELVVTDNATGDSVVQTKRFQIIRQAVASGVDAENEEEELLSEYSEVSEEKLDEEFEFIRYICQGSEKEVYEKLDLNGKREFMEQFWSRRDPNRATKVNEYKRDYFERIELANTRFSAGSKQGWRTDPGRVLLIYGYPDNIDRSYASLGNRESEVWQYYSFQGGVEFVFVNFSGYGELRLVHSTAVGEIQDYDWHTRWESR